MSRRQPRKQADAQSLSADPPPQSSTEPAIPPTTTTTTAPTTTTSTTTTSPHVIQVGGKSGKTPAVPLQTSTRRSTASGKASQEALHRKQQELLREQENIGHSCHQCKNSKTVTELIFCMNPEPDSVTLRQCRKKFCLGCLERSYNESIEKAIHSSSAFDPNVWSCPACRLLCSCASCKRVLKNKANKKSRFDPPATKKGVKKGQAAADGDDPAQSDAAEGGEVAETWQDNFMKTSKMKQKLYLNDHLFTLFGREPVYSVQADGDHDHVDPAEIINTTSVVEEAHHEAPLSYNGSTRRTRNGGKSGKTPVFNPMDDHHPTRTPPTTSQDPLPSRTRRHSTASLPQHARFDDEMDDQPRTTSTHNKSHYHQPSTSTSTSTMGDAPEHTLPNQLAFHHLHHHHQLSPFHQPLPNPLPQSLHGNVMMNNANTKRKAGHLESIEAHQQNLQQGNNPASMSHAPVMNGFNGVGHPNMLHPGAHGINQHPTSTNTLQFPLNSSIPSTNLLQPQLYLNPPPTSTGLPNGLYSIPQQHQRSLQNPNNTANPAQLSPHHHPMGTESVHSFQSGTTNNTNKRQRIGTDPALDFNTINLSDNPQQTYQTLQQLNVTQRTNLSQFNQLLSLQQSHQKLNMIMGNNNNLKAPVALRPNTQLLPANPNPSTASMSSASFLQHNAQQHLKSNFQQPHLSSIITSFSPQQAPLANPSLSFRGSQVPLQRNLSNVSNNSTNSIHSFHSNSGLPSANSSMHGLTALHSMPVGITSSLIPSANQTYLPSTYGLQLPTTAPLSLKHPHPPQAIQPNAISCPRALNGSLFCKDTVNTSLYQQTISTTPQLLTIPRHPTMSIAAPPTSNPPILHPSPLPITMHNLTPTLHAMEPPLPFVKPQTSTTPTTATIIPTPPSPRHPTFSADSFQNNLHEIDISLTPLPQTKSLTVATIAVAGTSTSSPILSSTTPDLNLLPLPTLALQHSGLLLPQKVNPTDKQRTLLQRLQQNTRKPLKPPSNPHRSAGQALSMDTLHSLAGGVPATLDGAQYTAIKLAQTDDTGVELSWLLPSAVFIEQADREETSWRIQSNHTNASLHQHAAPQSLINSTPLHNPNHNPGEGAQRSDFIQVPLDSDPQFNISLAHTSTLTQTQHLQSIATQSVIVDDAGIDNDQLDHDDARMKPPVYIIDADAEDKPLNQLEFDAALHNSHQRCMFGSANTFRSTAQFNHHPRLQSDAGSTKPAQTSHEEQSLEQQQQQQQQPHQQATPSKGQMVIPPLFTPYAVVPTSATTQSVEIYRKAQEFEEFHYKRSLFGPMDDSPPTHSNPTPNVAIADAYSLDQHPRPAGELPVSQPQYDIRSSQYHHLDSSVGKPSFILPIDQIPPDQGHDGSAEIQAISSHLHKMTLTAPPYIGIKQHRHHPHPTTTTTTTDQQHQHPVTTQSRPTLSASTAHSSSELSSPPAGSATTSSSTTNSTTNPTTTSARTQGRPGQNLDDLPTVKLVGLEESYWF